MSAVIPQQSELATVVERLIPALTGRLSQNATVDQKWSDSGELHIDRPVPFLCLYRQPADSQDKGTEQFITSEAAYLIASGETGCHGDLAKLSEAIGETLYNRFGAFLFVEVWARQADEAAEDSHLGGPMFRIVTPQENAPAIAAEALRKALATIMVEYQYASVDIVKRPLVAPPAMKPLYASLDAERFTCFHLGLEIKPVYRDAATGMLYPLLLANMRRQVAQALRQAFFAFAEHNSDIAAPEHYQALGPRALASALCDVDRQLQEVGTLFDFLLQVTPINTDAAWQEFRGNDFEQEPVFYYRPLSFHPDLLKRRLFNIPLEEIHDPTLLHLMREKRDELDLQISMLIDRGSKHFFYSSLQLYGSVEDELLDLAQNIMTEATDEHGNEADDLVGAVEFAHHAAREIAYYRQLSSEFKAEIELRDDIASGVMVADGRLLVASSLSLESNRVDPLLAHEIGTHLVTYYNGAAQPLQQLREGLADYEPLQEGLAVLAEYLVGGLSRSRLRILAARVIAVRAMIEGRSFVETFRQLYGDYDIPAHSAFTTTLRVFRGGGFTKDAVYLRGLRDLLAYLGTDGELAPLLIGKIGLEHVPLIEELRRREILRPPLVWPRYLNDSQAQSRLDNCRGRSLLDFCREYPQ